MVSIKKDCILSAPSIYIQQFAFCIKFHSNDVWGRKINHTEQGQIIRVSDYGIRFTSGMGAFSISWCSIDELFIIRHLLSTHLQKCPVCEGRGMVLRGFYEYGMPLSTNFGTETCHSCNGKGYIESEGDNDKT